MLFRSLRQQGVAIAVVDALSNPDLLTLGQALRGMPLVTAGSGVAIGLPSNWRIQPTQDSARLPPAQGLKAMVSGSCSLATQAQVAHFKSQGGHAVVFDPLAWPADTPAADIASSLLSHLQTKLNAGPVMVYSTADADQVKIGRAHV